MRTLILLKGLVKSEKLKWVKDEGLNNYLLDIEVIERLYSYPELSGFKKEVLRKSQSTLVYKQFIDKWDGKTPLYGIAPEFLKMTK